MESLDLQRTDNPSIPGNRPLIPGHLRGERPPGCKAPGLPHLRGAVSPPSEPTQRVPHSGWACCGDSLLNLQRTDRPLAPANRPPDSRESGGVPPR